MRRISGPKQAIEYPRLPDHTWVIWWSNGIKWPDPRRELSYLSKTKTHVLKGWALWTSNYEDAKGFESEEQARAWFAKQEAMRPLPYHDARITTIAELKRRCGYIQGDQS